ncbi:helix-turn-helix domain-containing protein [Paenibacillus cremeus]|uniref:Helix-turn-helix transcriptional regulator n=1 Tax=Paenibacillus cremeus TaxID=2163881 RepID=A0A559K5X3_9BACL|nr:helix-turn-helix domain-containing protein [Paenibacillus cremeus]TVY07548.1 helix-turn-helix transcriptional regulator [Paenibacillus cremeus]
MKKNTWLLHMMLSYIPVFLILFIVVFLVFFQNLIVLKKQDAVRANEIYAKQIMQSIDLSLKSIDHMIINEMLHGKLINEFFDESDYRNIYLNYQVSNRLQEIKHEFPSIDSINLVRFKDKVVFNGNITSFPDFADYPFISQENETAYFTKWTSVRRYKEFANQETKPVISLICKVPAYAEERGNIIVNVKISAIQELLMDLRGSEMTDIKLLDQNGGVIYGKNAPSQNGEVLASVTSEYTNWKIKTILASGIFTYASVFNYWTIFGFMMFLLAIAYLIYITKENYKPIKNIVSKIDDYSSQELKSIEKAASDEFNFIESVIDQFIGQYKDFEKQSEKNLYIRKRDFFNRVVFGDHPMNIDECTAEMRQLNIPNDLHERSVVILEIDKVGEIFETYSQRDQGLFRFILANVVSEIMTNHSVWSWTEWTGRYQLSAIIQYQDPTLNIVEICKIINAWVESNLKFTMTIGVGDSVDQITNISDSYRKALQSLKYKPALGNNNVIPYTDIQNYSLKNSSEYLKLINELIDLFRINSPNWEKVYDELFQKIKRDYLSKDEISILLNYFIYYLDLKISELPKEYYQVLTGDILPEMRSAINHCETTEEYRDEIIDLLNSYINHINPLRESKSNHKLMKRVKEYIEEQYANPNLSLDLLEEQFNVNAKYISLLFKQEFGGNFLDFLNNIRVEQAKIMLKSPNEPINEIGQRIGFNSPVTFRRTFKRLTGMTPSEYRNAL